MKLDVTKPVQTRSGRKARIIATGINHDCYTIAAVVEADGQEYIESFTTGGFHDMNEKGSSPNDLINIEEPKFDINKPFRCVNGSKAVLLHIDLSNSDFPYIVAYHDEDGPSEDVNWHVNMFTKDGKNNYYESGTHLDLVNY